MHCAERNAIIGRFNYLAADKPHDPQVDNLQCSITGERVRDNHKIRRSDIAVYYAGAVTGIQPASRLADKMERHVLCHRRGTLYDTVE
jgi:hypothetical protein